MREDEVSCLHDNKKFVVGGLRAYYASPYLGGPEDVKTAVTEIEVSDEGIRHCGCCISDSKTQERFPLEYLFFNRRAAINSVIGREIRSAEGTFRMAEERSHIVNLLILEYGEEDTIWDSDIALKLSGGNASEASDKE